MNKSAVLSILSFACGAAVWAGITQVSARREAWDSGIYFQIGLPIFYAMSGIFGYIEPQRSWRWGIFPFVGQFVWMIATAGIGNLMPLGIILAGVLAIPGIITAKAGAVLARKRTG